MNVRMTPQRLEILRILETRNELAAAVDVYGRIREHFPSISLDTVYRTLSLFENQWIIKKVYPLADKTRYNTNTQPHRHFVSPEQKGY